jgi:hypothetical protein
VPLAPVAAPAATAKIAAAPAPTPHFSEALGVRLAAPAPAAVAPPRPAPAALEAVERAQRRLDAILQAARSGRTFTAQELLGLQAEAYRTVQTVDLATKLVEQGAQSVKQALNTQL